MRTATPAPMNRFTFCCARSHCSVWLQSFAIPAPRVPEDAWAAAPNADGEPATSGQVPRSRRISTQRLPDWRPRKSSSGAPAPASALHHRPRRTALERSLTNRAAAGDIAALERDGARAPKTACAPRPDELSFARRRQPSRWLEPHRQDLHRRSKFLRQRLTTGGIHNSSCCVTAVRQCRRMRPVKTRPRG